MSERTVGLAEIVGVFLKIGAMSYGGPAIMGIMQTEIQERRQWIAKPQFVEGLALVNMLPGPGATQLAIYLGHAKAGLAGGVLAGICFILPAFAIMLALASIYAAFGTLPSMRNAFYGIGPVVVGIFAVSVYRLGRAAMRDKSQIAIAFAAVVLMFYAPVSLVATLLAAGCVGIGLFHSRRAGLIALAVLFGIIAACDAVAFLTSSAPISNATLDPAPGTRGLWEVAAFFLKVGAFTFGGGLTMLAFIQEQVVSQMAWLTPQEFVDGLALGQLTPGPVLMVAAFVGFKLFGRGIRNLSAVIPDDAGNSAPAAKDV
jgi:chromate transporter